MKTRPWRAPPKRVDDVDVADVSVARCYPRRVRSRRQCYPPVVLTATRHRAAVAAAPWSNTSAVRCGSRWLLSLRRIRTMRASRTIAAAARRPAGIVRIVLAVAVEVEVAHAGSTTAAAVPTAAAVLARKMPAVREHRPTTSAPRTARTVRAMVSASVGVVVASAVAAVVRRCSTRTVSRFRSSRTSAATAATVMVRMSAATAATRTVALRAMVTATSARQSASSSP